MPPFPPGRILSLLILPAALALGASDDGLVAHWKFDEAEGPTVHDARGRNHGTIHGGRWAAGVDGHGLLFEAAGAFVQVEPDPSLDLSTELTITAWIRPENFDTPLVNKLVYYKAGNYDFRTERNGALVLGHECGPGERPAQYESTGRLTVARWHHVAVSLKLGGAVRFYIDGAPAGEAKQVGRFGAVNREPLRIGAKPDPYSSFHGIIDEVRIYRRELAIDEIRRLAARPDVTSGAALTAPEQGAAGKIHTVPGPVRKSGVDVNAEWPQWLGRRRDGKSTETGLLQRWPDGGPDLLWCAEGFGEGYSTVSIADGRIYTTGMINREEVLFALDLNGRSLWQQTYGPAWKGRYPEARTTPTLDDGRAYVITGMGRIVCLEARNGKELWAFDAAKEFGTKYHFWGIAESPLVIGDLVICTPCGSKATFAALDKKSGRVVWASKSLGEESGYCSPIGIAFGGRQIIVTMLKKSIAGVDAASGEILWRLMYEDYQPSPHGINPNSPLYHEGSFYTTSGYECGGARHQLSGDGRTVTRQWADKVLDSHHGGALLIDGYIYGSNFKGHYDGNWVCLDWATGQVKYETKWLNKGSLTYADGRLYCYEEKNGTVGLVKPSPARFEVISSFRIPKGTGPHWAYPVVCGGRLYIRHGNALMAFDIKGGPL